MTAKDYVDGIVRDYGEPPYIDRIACLFTSCPEPVAARSGEYHDQDAYLCHGHAREVSAAIRALSPTTERRS